MRAGSGGGGAAVEAQPGGRAGRAGEQGGLEGGFALINHHPFPYPPCIHLTALFTTFISPPPPLCAGRGA